MRGFYSVPARAGRGAQRRQAEEARASVFHSGCDRRDSLYGHPRMSVDDMRRFLRARVFHYTVLKYLPQVLTDQELRPTTAGVAATERPAVWFTTRPTWEPTANKMWRTGDGRLVSLSTEETAIRGGGLIRIEVNPEVAPFTWADHVRLSGITKTMARALERVGSRDGSDPGEWRGGSGEGSVD